MTEPISAAALIIWLKAIVPAFIGACIGIFQNKEKPFGERAIAFLTGIAVAHYGGNGLVDYFAVTSAPIRDLLVFSLGLFGMNLIHSIKEQIQPFVKSMREKITGGEK